MSTTADRHYKTGELLKRFAPYLFKYKKLMAFDLFCAALTTLCDIVLPRIMSTLTNTAMYNAADLTVSLVICMTLICTVIVAKFVGCSLPILAKKVGFDPAVMASPFITTIVDALSLLIYFQFASHILGI